MQCEVRNRLWVRDYEAENEAPEHLFFKEFRGDRVLQYKTKKTPWNGAYDKSEGQVIPLICCEPGHSRKILKIFSSVADCLNTKAILKRLASVSKLYKKPYFVDTIAKQSLMIMSKGGKSLKNLWKSGEH